MLDISILKPIIAIAAFAYVAFVFFSESLNPFWFGKRQGHRTRWRYARSVALTLFAIPTIALIAEPYLGLPRLQLAIATAILCLVLCLYHLYVYLHSKYKSTKEERLTPPVKPFNEIPAQAQSNTSMPVSTQTIETAVVESNNAAMSHSTQDISIVAEELSAPELSVSDEHKIEAELTQSTHEPDLDHLDQTIADAEFTDADLSLFESVDVAQPDLANSLDDTTLDDLYNASEALSDLPTEGFGEPHSTHQQRLDDDTSELNDALLRKLDTQNEEIKNLAKSNQALISTKESLVGEMAELKYSLQKSNAIARKGIAQRDEAIKVKNNALTLAAMERKKRQLTEIKARKALMRMKNSIRELTDQRV